MTGKEYFSQVFQLDAQINCKIEQLFTLNAMITKPTTENIFTRISNLQREIDADIDRLVDLKAEMSARA